MVCLNQNLVPFLVFLADVEVGVDVVGIGGVVVDACVFEGVCSVDVVDCLDDFDL